MDDDEGLPARLRLPDSFAEPGDPIRHKTEAVYRRYDIVDSQDLREAMRKVGGLR